jgi:hypothetical protein
MSNLDADALFAAALLRESKEEKPPMEFNFSSPLLVRSPWLWVLAFEVLDLKEEDFLTPHQTRGKIGDIFRRCAEKTFSGRDEPPFSAPLALQDDLEELTVLFCSLGVVYGSVPLSTDVTVTAAITKMLNILRPHVTLAQNVLRRLNAAFVGLQGGSAEKFVVTRRLDPSLFSADDREALRRATVRQEGFLERATRQVGNERRRPREAAGGGGGGVCRQCSASFEGLWSHHWRTSCAKNAKKR